MNSPMRKHLHLFMAVVLVAVALYNLTAAPFSTSSARAEASSPWTLRVAPDQPPERRIHAMAYDCARNVTVLFGGLEGPGIMYLGDSDTWELSGTTWTRHSSAHFPSVMRVGGAMAYDEARHEVILYDGDVWAWDGTDWTLKTWGAVPSLGWFPGFAYDRGRSVIVAYGGSANTYETWEWDGSAWTKNSPDHTPILDRPKLAYDSARARMVLFGKNPNGIYETWEYDGTDWTNRNPASAPSPVLTLAMVYDETINRTMLLTSEPFGASAVNRMWEWDGTQWSVRTPTTQPEYRIETTMVFDRGRGKVILYGGSGITVFKDTWEWDGASGNWSETIVPANPPSSWGPMVYDSAHSEIVYSGGMGRNLSVFVETWTLSSNATRWTQQYPQHMPIGRTAFALAFDTQRSKTVLFGGTVYNGPYPTETYPNDTWEWDGTDWTQKQIANAPDGRAGEALAYDPDHGSIVLFGGSIYHGGAVTWKQDTWEYDGVNWVQKFPLHSPPSRHNAGMVYDIQRHKMVLFGGAGPSGPGPLNDTWEWDGEDWVERQLPQSPSRRQWPVMTYDAAQHVTVLFGGNYPGTDYGDTWEYDGNTWTPISADVVPSPRVGGMAYDSNRKAVVLFGSAINDTWEYRSQTNTPPEIHVDNGTVTTLVGQTAANSGTYADANADDDVNITASVGKVTKTGMNNGTWQWSYPATDGPSQSQTVTVTADDGHGGIANASFTLVIDYAFPGFLQPVDNTPTPNRVNAGQGIPIMFNLNGNWGLNILRSGYPTSQKVACPDSAPNDDIEQTTTTNAGLTYDASSGLYTYVWKTQKSWAGTCRQFNLGLNDGSSHTALFSFR